MNYGHGSPASAANPKRDRLVNGRAQITCRQALLALGAGSLALTLPELLEACAQGASGKKSTVRHCGASGEDEDMSDEKPRRTRIIWDGGSETDRKQLLEVHKRFFRSHDSSFDAAGLRTVWSDDDNCIFFHSNGYTYWGLDDWLKAWDYYRPRLRLTKPSVPKELTIIVRSEMAVIIADHIERYWDWRANEPRPAHTAGSPYFRATQVCVRERDQWKVVHAHFSSGYEGPRQGD